ncbi:MAG TPA: P1 family peptidase, partial [Desulfobaccales bacterium]
KGGLGTAFVTGIDGLLVGAMVVVNALGDVVNPESGEILAGARKTPDSREFADSTRLVRQGLVRRQFGESNTTIGVVATNARLNREEARKIAQLGHDALARCIRPVHTLFDGDTIFVLARPQMESDLQIIGLLAETVLQQAIVRAVKSAQNLGVLPAYRDLRGRRGR